MENGKNILFKNEIVEITEKSIHFNNKLSFFKKGIEDTVLISSVQSISIFKYKNYGLVMEGIGKLIAAVILSLAMFLLAGFTEKGIFLFGAITSFILALVILYMIIKSIIGYDAISLNINGEEKMITGKKEEVESAYTFLQNKIFN